MDWGIFSKQEIRPSIGHSSTDFSSTHQEKQGANISEKLQHCTLELWRGSILAPASTFTNPVLSLSLSQYMYYNIGII